VKRVHRQCANDYRHYFVQTDHTFIELDPDIWDRTLQLECARCGYVLWIDSVIRIFDKIPEVWKGT